MELFSAIFDITAYWPPVNTQLPDDYKPPPLAISKLYWKGWILLLVLAAFNPKTVGKAYIRTCILSLPHPVFAWYLLYLRVNSKLYSNYYSSGRN